MQRRRFLGLGAATGMAAALPACRQLEHLGIPISVLRPGMVEGHRLRDAAPLPPATREIRTGVAILGSGIAGLTAAWRLARAGHTDFLLLDGPEPDGNAAAGTQEGVPHPRGAHYLPLPSLESRVVREILREMGVIEDAPFAARPRYAETVLVHEPDERLWFEGQWCEGLLPTAHVDADEAAQLHRFMDEMARLQDTRGADGQRVFTVPLALSSADPGWRALDAQTFGHWLTARGYTAPSLLAWLDYVCRDEYGAGPERISAWFGLHYFASRGGHAANARDGSVLTWPDGLAPLARHLRTSLAPGCQRAGMAWRIDESPHGVSILASDADGPFRILAERAICAMPLHVSARIVPDMPARGFDPARHAPPLSPWLVANFLLDGFPAEAGDVPLAWDNVIHGSPGLGWVVATHQWLRAARPPRTVFTAYRALADRSPADARRWLESASAASLYEMASEELRRVYGGPTLWRLTRAVEITLRGHGMACPVPGTLSNAGLGALRQARGRLLFAHADLSGYSVFEEAAHWGDQAAQKILAG
ncbi:NAD(P)/FAD-dependent oxidoreductase [Zoogloea sp.]|uniref:FAD-dependent oxidoreductase n=1 Tax=Zoogloea sp. TaxID=49181 RepID=UPI0014157DA6|nr:MAG: FAD-dependent oxidoreductase [Zoogloea sp.]